MEGPNNIIKVIKMLLKNVSVSEDCVFITDEMYLLKIIPYHSGYYRVDADAKGNLYEGVVVFLKALLKNSITCVEKTPPETSVGVYWLSKEIDKSITNLKEIGQQLGAVVSGDHTSKNFDIIHWIKINRNNLLNRRKFVFSEYHFDLLDGANTIDLPADCISWRMFYIYNLDENFKETFVKH